MMGVIDFEITLKSLEQLNKIINKIEAISDVVLVERCDLQSSHKSFKGR